MHQVTATIGSVIPTYDILVRIDFQHVLGPVRIVQECGQAFHESRATRSPFLTSEALA